MIELLIFNLVLILGIIWLISRDQHYDYKKEELKHKYRK